MNKKHGVAMAAALLVLAACGSMINKSEPKTTDLARVVAGHMKDKPIVYVETKAQEPELNLRTIAQETVKAPPEGIVFMLCSKPGIPGYDGNKTDALSATILGFNARGMSIDECNEHNAKMAKKMGAPIR